MPRGQQQPGAAPEQTPADAVAAPGRGGRKRDEARDGEILDAALEVLAEVGYAGMTMDMVAARAKAGKATVYRRWSSKEEVVLGAVAQMKRGLAPLDQLPDTGSLRSDLLALFKPQSASQTAFRMNVMAGLVSMISTHPGLQEAVHDAVVTPWAEAHLALMARAVERGEISRSAKIHTVSQVVATAAAYRSLIQRKPFDRAFLVTWLDDVVLPALQPDPAENASG